METTQMATQMIGFQKTALDNSFNAVTVIQDQTESLLNNVLGQFPWVTPDGKKQISEAFAFTRKARDDFKKAIDDGYARLEKLIDQN